MPRARLVQRPPAGWTAMSSRSKLKVEVCDARKGNGSAKLRKHGPMEVFTLALLVVAARLAKDSIQKVEVLEYPELGMEAVWKIEVEDFPAFIVVDDKTISSLKFQLR